ncbi:hypothetical protein [Eudoraea chungangensis]|uniref:hypothetical protein n=1 Tax=Eudoraea chungangensis TaxID=1481905 RepID=UPI0023EB84EF|nr:hypothetical protein [Eudoraea chungangensis]
MNLLIFLLAFIFCSHLYAQEERNKGASFVRVYDLNGTKLSKGRILQLTDSSMVIVTKDNSLTIKVSKIGSIKTKRSAGHNILVGATIGVGTGAILGLASGGENEWWGKGEGAGGFGLAFGLMGAGIGAITAIFKNDILYPIAGNLSNWKAFKEAFEAEAIEK